MISLKDALGLVLALVVAAHPIGPAKASDSLGPNEPLLVVTMGTSLTASIDWQPVLAARLGACLGRPVRVEKVAESGVTSRWGLEQVGRVVALRPEIVVLEFAMNDANWRRFVSRAESRANAAAIARRLREALPGTRLYLMTTNPVHGLRGAMRPIVEAYYRRYRDLAVAEGFGLIDAARAWRALSDERRRRAIPDGVHPTLEGFVETAIPAMLSALTDGRCR